MSEQDIPIACNFNAIPADHREQHGANAQNLFASVLEMRELPDGYAFRLPNDAESIIQVAEWIRYERLCCPFFTFGMTAEPQQGDIWFQLTGAPEVKQFIPAEIGDLLAESVVKS